MKTGPRIFGFGANNFTVERFVRRRFDQSLAPLLHFMINGERAGVSVDLYAHDVRRLRDALTKWLDEEAAERSASVPESEKPPKV